MNRAYWTKQLQEAEREQNWCGSGSLVTAHGKSGGRYQPLELQAAAKGRHDRQAVSAAGVLPSAMTDRPAAWAPASEGGGGPVLGGRNALNIAARKLQRARAELARLEDEN